mmetsp:Transcript_22970/g.58255  ORF Transcript_22970/g.58255 Transcript_22970/m.58255 type:complete len:181 (-) Transcript_22970:606-1148(-)
MGEENHTIFTEKAVPAGLELKSFYSLFQTFTYTLGYNFAEADISHLERLRDIGVPYLSAIYAVAGASPQVPRAQLRVFFVNHEGDSVSKALREGNKGLVCLQPTLTKQRRILRWRVFVRVEGEEWLAPAHFVRDDSFSGCSTPHAVNLVLGGSDLPIAGESGMQNSRFFLFDHVFTTKRL